MPDYDIITVGGGIAGASLARAMAARGCRVLVLESSTEFKDRVRGEFICPWGVMEARELGVYDAIMAAGGREARFLQVQAGPAPLPPRNLIEDIGEAAVNIYHPAMQEAVLVAAAAAGAEVRRGARVTGVSPGETPSVAVDGETASARLVVGTDGRNSSVRSWADFEAEEDEPQQWLAGVLVDGMTIDPDVSIIAFNFALGQISLLSPQGSGRARAYFGARTATGTKLTGDAHFARFVDESVRTGISAASYEGATQAGPLATFDGYDSWVPHPYKDGVALIGDAAATSDQTWGQGVSIALSHARLLRDALLSDDDWTAAGNAYAAYANEMFGHIRRAESWLTELMMDPGEEANAVRAKVLPRLFAEEGVIPDTMMAGPRLAPADDAARARMLGNA
ncbi:MAG TPA: NAD(P)/FAD-dependent oxidoreductase [Dehalococcoidia bacterium]|nr:NAD(P)/FAD-dependent oxidoreductase [Dehalococcoidia bacterium]